MKNVFIRFLSLLTFISIFLTSCQKESMERDSSNSSEFESVLKLDNTYFIKKLDNPYSVENMQKALNNLLENSNLEIVTLQASHYYVKFKPHSEDDLSLLKQDTTLNLYSYPLDYEIIEGTTTYDDPSVPKGEPTFQYASVQIEYSFPTIDYDILEELFIPEEINECETLTKVSVDELVTEALRITNNLEENDEQYRASKWRPAGKMQVWDDNIGDEVPIKHLKVRARRWFTTYTGITNSEGNYTCNGRFRRKANYSLQFERHDFEIRDAWLSTANINGPKKKGDWNLIMRDGKKEFWATIFRATSHYYYDNIKNLRRPPQNSFWNTQLKLRAMYEPSSSNGTHCASCRFLGLGSAIKIYNPQHNSRDIYATTVHEISHASHWKMSSWHYNNASTIVVESWARAVQWELTRMIYPGYQPTYARLNYTGVVQDMIDGYGIKGTSYWWDYDEDDFGSPYLYRSYYDQITGYTIRQIEDALYGETHWDNWKNNIINSYYNATENNLDNSFDYWNTY